MIRKELRALLEARCPHRANFFTAPLSKGGPYFRTSAKKCKDRPHENPLPRRAAVNKLKIGCRFNYRSWSESRNSFFTASGSARSAAVGCWHVALAGFEELN